MSKIKEGKGTTITTFIKAMSNSRGPANAEVVSTSASLYRATTRAETAKGIAAR